MSSLNEIMMTTKRSERELFVIDRLSKMSRIKSLRRNIKYKIAVEAERTLYFLYVRSEKGMNFRMCRRDSDHENDEFDTKKKLIFARITHFTGSPWKLVRECLSET